ncbi:hypothetical protein BDW72DRAFT_196172 [Aspergillus terricola var. indicus]
MENADSEDPAYDGVTTYSTTFYVLTSGGEWEEWVPLTLTSESAITTFDDKPTTEGIETTETIADDERTHKASKTSADLTSSPVTVTVYSPLPTETDTGGGGGGSLSSGAKAGIGVGVAFGVIFIVAVGAVSWFRRRKKRSGDYALQEPPVITQTASVKAAPPFELNRTGRQVFELPGKGKVGEHSASENSRYELDT